MPAGTVDVDSLPAPADLLAEMHGDLTPALIPEGWVSAEAGRDLSPELRAIWSKEGGFEHNAAQVWMATSSIEAAVSDPAHLNSTLAMLPESLKARMLDTLRMSPQRGGAKAAESAFMESLSDAELTTYCDWCDALSDDQRWAILCWFNGQYR